MLQVVTRKQLHEMPTQERLCEKFRLQGRIAFPKDLTCQITQFWGWTEVPIT